jgi:hypothetical protein
LNQRIEKRSKSAFKLTSNGYVKKVKLVEDILCFRPSHVADLARKSKEQFKIKGKLEKSRFKF